MSIRCRSTARFVPLLVLAAAVTFGAVMAWSQIVLSRHYPTDTLGGFCAALVVVPATAWLFDRTAHPAERA